MCQTQERSLEGKLIAYNNMPENIMPLFSFNSDESCFQNIGNSTLLSTAEELQKVLNDDQRKAMIWYNVYLLNANIRNFWLFTFKR